MKLLLLLGAMLATSSQAQLEAHPGSCVPADEAYTTYSFLQAEFGTQSEFETECDVNGACMGGETGCCRITQGAYECDTDDPPEFPAAVCICNEFTAPRSAPPPPAQVPVQAPPTPTVMPTMLVDNCQRYNSSSPYFTSENTWVPLLEMSGISVTECIVDSDCEGGSGFEPCCMASFCFCYTPDAVLTSNQCVGGATIPSA